MNEVVKGGCLCGQVQYQVEGPFEQFHICHCSQCRRSTGTAHASNIFTSEDKIKWLSGSHCGSLVPYISAGSGKLIVPAGGLSADPQIRPEDNIFWEDRAPWYDDVATAPHFDAFPKKTR